MSMRTRFAPSPTGRLHLGHVLAAKVAHSLAREAGGVFLLRHEDIDGPRVREEYYRGIEEDLRWLGLDWDGEPLRQTGRIAAYDAALDSLRERNLVYPCFCTRREIQEEWARIGAAPQGPEAPVYPGTCRPAANESGWSVSLQNVPGASCSQSECGAAEQDAIRQKLLSGASYAWRLDSARAAELTGPLTFRDLRFGEIPVNAALLGDVVLARKDIGTAYHLAVVVDDAFQKITHVTRGEDLLNSTHVHRLLQILLDLPEPVYLHHELVRDEKGNRLAKRNDALSIASLRESGMTPEEVRSLIPV